MSDRMIAGRTVLVTGASDGIDAETTRVLASS
jgi:NAD(P)-dependent dehydrogenase (short-subunit alcohol dehydrogenase family)